MRNKKTAFWAIIIAFMGLLLSCSLDPYGDGLGNNSTGGNTNILVPNIEIDTGNGGGTGGGTGGGGNNNIYGTIKIVNNDDYPITQWILYNSSGDIVKWSSTEISAGSSYSITSVPPGTYKVNVMGGWFGWMRNETTEYFKVISGYTNTITLSKNEFRWTSY